MSLYVLCGLQRSGEAVLSREPRPTRTQRMRPQGRPHHVCRGSAWLLTVLPRSRRDPPTERS